MKTAPRKWKGGTRGGRYGNLFYVTLLRAGGLALVPFFQFWTVLYFVCVATEGRRVSVDLARRLGRGESSWQRFTFAFRHFYTFATLLIDRVAILGVGLRDKYELTADDDAVRRALAHGKGLIVLTGHIGNWEVMGECLGSFDVPSVLVMYDGVSPKMRATMDEMSRNRSFSVLYTDGSPASASAILAALQRGEIVGMMGDRVLAGKSARLPFVDGHAEFPLAPYVLAATSGAPLMHSFLMRRAKRKYELGVAGIGILSFSSRAERAGDLTRWAAEYAEHLEDELRRHPFQWGNFFPFFVEQETSP